MNKTDIFLLVAIIGWITVVIFIPPTLSNADYNKRSAIDLLDCKNLSKYFEQTHEEYARTIILEKCVIGEKSD